MNTAIDKATTIAIVLLLLCFVSAAPALDVDSNVIVVFCDVNNLIGDAGVGGSCLIEANSINYNYNRDYVFNLSYNGQIWEYINHSTAFTTTRNIYDQPSNTATGLIITYIPYTSLSVTSTEDTGWKATYFYSEYLNEGLYLNEQTEKYCWEIFRGWSAGLNGFAVVRDKFEEMNYNMFNCSSSLLCSVMTYIACYYGTGTVDFRTPAWDYESLACIAEKWLHEICKDCEPD